MTLTLNLPEALAARLAAILPEGERDRFALAAIEDALSLRQEHAEVQLQNALLADFDREQDNAEYRAIIEQALDDVDAGCALVSFEDAQRRFEVERQTPKV